MLQTASQLIVTKISKNVVCVTIKTAIVQQLSGIVTKISTDTMFVLILRPHSNCSAVVLQSDLYSCSRVKLYNIYIYIFFFLKEGFCNLETEARNHE